MRELIVKPTDIDGIYLVYRADGEPPIAQLTAPKLMPRRRGWGIRYRNGNGSLGPFSGGFNVTHDNRVQAIDDIERCVMFANDYQLGLK